MAGSPGVGPAGRGGDGNLGQFGPEGAPGQPGQPGPAPVDIVAAGPSAPRRLLEQLPSVTGPVEALARVEFCGQGVDLIAELG